ncbi:MAG: hypothetical protein P4M00_16390 [Azospirillaceae bacterium]|nr:hypothetical protein [Azospirillaceae bacterium]
MSTLSDALSALKTAFLLEERVSSQARKVEKLADMVGDIDRRLAKMEGQMQGFVAAATAFSGGGATGLGHRIIGNPGPEKLPSPKGAGP